MLNMNGLDNIIQPILYKEGEKYMLRKIIDVITLAILLFIFAIIFAIIFMSNLSTIKTIMLIVLVGGLCVLTIMTYIDKIKRWRK